MDIKEFKQYTKNLDEYDANEVDEFEPLTDAELDAYQNELEREGGGNFSDWDELRVILTFRKLLADKALEETK